MMDQSRQSEEQNYSVNAEVTFVDGHTVSYSRIFRRVWPYGVSIFLVFFISLAVYPAVTVLVESQNKGQGYAWNGRYIFIKANH